MKHISDLCFAPAFRFSIPHSNELFLENRERCLVYQLLRKYFHALLIKSSLLVLILYLFFQCFLFSMAFITSTLVTSQSYSSHCSSALQQPFLYGEDHSLPFLKYHSPFHSSPYHFLLKSTHICLTVFQLVSFYYQLSSY